LYPSFYQFLFEKKYPSSIYLYRFFYLREVVDKKILLRFFKRDDLDKLIKAGLILEKENYYQSKMRVTPYREKYFYHKSFEETARDLLPPHEIENAFLGVNSIDFADFWIEQVKGRRFKRALDLGTGSGIQAILLSEFCNEVMTSDIQESALHWAGINARINNSEIKLRLSDLFENIRGKFDLILFHFPWIANDSSGLDFIIRVLDKLDEYLNKDGEFYGNPISPIIDGRDVLIEEVRKNPQGKNYHIELFPMRYFCTIHQGKEYYEFVRKQGISRIIYYFMKITKKRGLTIKRRKMGIFKNFFWKSYVFADRLKSQSGL